MTAPPLPTVLVVLMVNYSKQLLLNPTFADTKTTASQRFDVFYDRVNNRGALKIAKTLQFWHSDGLRVEVNTVQWHVVGNRKRHFKLGSGLVPSGCGIDFSSRTTLVHTSTLNENHLILNSEGSALELSLCITI